MPPPVMEMLSPIDNRLRIKVYFSSRDSHWGDKPLLGHMPSIDGQRKTNSTASLEVPCLITSSQGFLIYLFFSLFSLLPYRSFAYIVFLWES